MGIVQYDQYRATKLNRTISRIKWLQYHTKKYDIRLKMHKENKKRTSIRSKR